MGARNNETIVNPSRLVYSTGCKFEIYEFFERKNSLAVGLFAASLLPQV